MEYKTVGELSPATVGTGLQVVIPFRTPDLTRAALRFAARFAADLESQIRLIDVHVVPYGIPLDKPTVAPEYLARRIRRIARESALPVSAEIVYARDWEQGFRRAIKEGSLILMAVRRSWWPNGDKRLAARLRKAGHQVVWVDCT